jgi:DNA-binding Lrp family transcriptional regulator
VPALDPLDVALLEALREHPRAGPLELSRIVRVARGTVQARLHRLEEAGVVTGYGPDVDLVAAELPVQAFVTLEIAQGDLDRVAADLAAVPEVLEAYATTGQGDVVCRVAARSHEDLQSTLLRLDRSPSVARSNSVVVLSTVVRPRVLPLLRAEQERRGRRRAAPRAPAYRDPADRDPPDRGPG